MQPPTTLQPTAGGSWPRSPRQRVTDRIIAAAPRLCGLATDNRSYEPAYDLAAYDPTTDRWHPIADAPNTPTGIGSPVWTGSAIFVPSTGSPTTDIHERPAGPNRPFTQLAAWDPGSDHWVSLLRSPQAVYLPTPVWTGQELLYRSAMSANATGPPGWSFGR
jgi:hypothetical protein